MGASQQHDGADSHRGRRHLCPLGQKHRSDRHWRHCRLVRPLGFRPRISRRTGDGRPQKALRAHCARAARRPPPRTARPTTRAGGCGATRSGQHSARRRPSSRIGQPARPRIGADRRIGTRRKRPYPLPHPQFAPRRPAQHGLHGYHRHLRPRHGHHHQHGHEHRTGQNRHPHPKRGRNHHPAPAPTQPHWAIAGLGRGGRGRVRSTHWGVDGATVGRYVPDGRRRGRGCRARGVAGRRHHHPCLGGTAHVAPQCAHPQIAGRGNPRLRHRYLLR